MSVLGTSATQSAKSIDPDDTLQLQRLKKILYLDGKDGSYEYFNRVSSGETPSCMQALVQVTVLLTACTRWTNPQK